MGALTGPRSRGERERHQTRHKYPDPGSPEHVDEADPARELPSEECADEPRARAERVRDAAQSALELRRHGGDGDGPEVNAQCQQPEPRKELKGGQPVEAG